MILVLLWAGVLSVEERKSDFFCGLIWDVNTDEEALEMLENAVEARDRIGKGCISTLINKNFYKSAKYIFQNYYRKKKNISQGKPAVS